VDYAIDDMTMLWFHMFAIFKCEMALVMSYSCLVE